MSKEIKKFKVSLEVHSIENLDNYFSNNTHAAMIVDNMIGEAISFNLRIIGKTDNEGLIKYLEAKIKCYEKIRESII